MCDIQEENKDVLKKFAKNELASPPLFEKRGLRRRRWIMKMGEMTTPSALSETQTAPSDDLT